jgi:hypothetical protein
MLKPQGYVTVFGDFRTQEFDTISCGHCGLVVHVKPGTASTVYVFPQMDGPPKEEMGAHCRICDTAVCLTCHHVGTCTPRMRRIEAMEGDRLARARLGMSS